MDGLEYPVMCLCHEVDMMQIDTVSLGLCEADRPGFNLVNFVVSSLIWWEGLRSYSSSCHGNSGVTSGSCGGSSSHGNSSHDSTVLPFLHFSVGDYADSEMNVTGCDMWRTDGKDERLFCSANIVATFSIIKRLTLL